MSRFDHDNDEDLIGADSDGNLAVSDSEISLTYPMSDQVDRAGLGDNNDDLSEIKSEEDNRTDAVDPASESLVERGGLNGVEEDEHEDEEEANEGDIEVFDGDDLTDTESVWENHDEFEMAPDLPEAPPSIQPYLPGDNSLPHVNRYLRVELVRSTPTVEAGQVCAICQEAIKDAASLPCKHAFCAVCILHWMQSSRGNNCPMCRKRVFAQHVYPLRPLPEHEFLRQRRAYRLTHDAELIAELIERSQAVSLKFDAAMITYALRRAYEPLSGIVSPGSANDIFLPFEDIEPHLSIMAVLLPRMWPKRPSRIIMTQWRHIVNALITLLRTDWRDQEGSSAELLHSDNGMDLVESIFSRLGNKTTEFTNDPSKDGLSKWWCSMNPPDPFDADPEESTESLTKYCSWTLMTLCRHVVSMGRPL